MVSSSPTGCADSKWRRGEVLHLLQLVVHLFGDSGKFGHIANGTARVTADEVGDELLL